jgi:hypothetical protein
MVALDFLHFRGTPYSSQRQKLLYALEQGL